LGWGSQIYTIETAVAMVEKNRPGVSIEVIDLRTIAPWDVETITSSVNKTGRLVVCHEAPLTGGFAGEIAAMIQDRCFLSLEAPVARVSFTVLMEKVCGFDTPFPLIYERFYVPGVARCVDGIQRVLDY
jgi:2-oxoisovalerate dehydrogenase E1 component beta subunit